MMIFFHLTKENGDILEKESEKISKEINSIISEAASIEENCAERDRSNKQFMMSRTLFWRKFQLQMIL